MPDGGNQDSRRPPPPTSEPGQGRPAPRPPAPNRPPPPPLRPVAAAGPVVSGAPVVSEPAPPAERTAGRGPVATTWLVPAAVAAGVGLAVLAASAVLIMSPAMRQRLAGTPSPTRDDPSVDPRPATRPDSAQPAASTPPSAVLVIRQRAADAARRATENSETAQAAAAAAAKLVADVDERVDALEASAAQAEKDCDERRSPVSAVERARLQDREIQPLLRDVTDRCRIARDATAGAAASRSVADERRAEARGCLAEAEKSLAAAEAAPNRNDRVVAGFAAERKATADVVEAVRLDAERAETAAAAAAEAAAAAGAAGDQAQSLAERIRVATARLDVAERRVAAAQAAFADLKTRLGGRAHRPEEGIDGRVGGPQTRVLCAVSDAVVEPHLPEEIAPGSGLRLRCVPAAAAETWDVVAEPAGGGAAMPLGTVAVAPDRRLTMTVVARDERNAVARDALATAVLRMDNPLNAAATTYVQLCQPVEAGPLVLDRFFDGRQGDTRPEFPHYGDGYPCDVAIPATPWSTRLGITGRCGTVVGEVVEGGQRRDGPAGARPLTLAWSWLGTPFLETDILLDVAVSPPDGGITVRLGAARLLEPWDSPARLGFPGQVGAGGGRKPSFGGLPTREQLDARARNVPAVEIQAMAKALGKKQPALSDAVVKEVVAAIKAWDDKASHLQWADRLRNVLTATPGFRQWADAGDTPPQPSFPGSTVGRPESKPAETRRQLDAYSADLLGRQGVVEADASALLVCRLIAELEATDAEKAIARELLDALDDRTATFEGELVATFPSASGRCVLASFAGGRPEVRRRKPRVERTGAMPSGPATSTVAGH